MSGDPLSLGARDGGEPHGRDPKGSGSRERGPAVPASGFDPSRIPAARIERLAPNVSLYLGDCTDIVPEIVRPDLVLTDAPYGVTYQSNHRVGQGSKPITNDGTRLSLRLYKRLLPHYVGCPVLWFTRWDAWPDVYDIFGALMKINGLLVWDKGHNGMGDLAHFGNDHEFIASAGPVKLRGSRDGSVLEGFKPVPPHRRYHPTEKPVGLLRYIVEKTSDPGAVVADPFMGSGATGIAAVLAGRGFQGIETDPLYFGAACRRIAHVLRHGVEEGRELAMAPTRSVGHGPLFSSLGDLALGIEAGTAEGAAFGAQRESPVGREAEAPAIDTPGA